MAASLALAHRKKKAMRKRLARLHTAAYGIPIIRDFTAGRENAVSST
jgi:hypothetical protein